MWKGKTCCENTRGRGDGESTTPKTQKGSEIQWMVKNVIHEEYTAKVIIQFQFEQKWWKSLHANYHYITRKIGQYRISPYPWGPLYKPYHFKCSTVPRYQKRVYIRNVFRQYHHTISMAVEVSQYHQFSCSISLYHHIIKLISCTTSNSDITISPISCVEYHITPQKRSNITIPSLGGWRALVAKKNASILFYQNQRDKRRRVFI